MIQRRAARWVSNRHHNTSSVSDMLHTLGWTSLEHRRATSRLCMLFQIYHGSIGIPHDPYILPYRHNPRPSRQNRPSQHTSAGLTILNVLSSPKQLLLGMHSLKVWSLAPHWMHSGGTATGETDTVLAFLNTPTFPVFSPPTFYPSVLPFFYLLSCFYLLCTNQPPRAVTCNKPHTLSDAVTGRKLRNTNRNGRV